MGIVAVWWGALRRVPALWRALLAVNLTCALLGVVLLAPLPGLVGRGLMHLSGNAALTDQAIAAALLTPFGLTALVLGAMSFVVVRLGGVPCSPLPWRWGYGWPACH